MSQHLFFNNIATIFLRKINPDQIIRDYFEGKYRNITLESLENLKNLKKVTFHEKKFNIIPEFPTQRDSEIYTYKDKNNASQKIYTTNRGKLKSCLWCLKPLGANPIGIPVRLQEFYDNGQKIYQFYIDQIYYCSFECCYSGLKRFLNFPPNYRDITYSNSEYLLKFMYFLTTGQRDLQEAPDFRVTVEHEEVKKTAFKKIGFVNITPLHPEFLEYKYEESTKPSAKSPSPPGPPSLPPIFDN